MRHTYLWPVIMLCAGALISLSLVGDSKLCGQNGHIVALSDEPSDSFIFQLELGGQVVAEYAECFGLGSSNEIEESVVQTDAGAVKQKTPGALEWHNITLKRAGVTDRLVWEWRQAMTEGKLDEALKDGAIVMRAPNSSEQLARWTFTNGWPAALIIQGSSEELTIVLDGLKRVTPVTTTPRRPTKW
jgi:phage tail-like protein